MSVSILQMMSTPRCEVEACDTAPFIERMSPLVAKPQPEHAGGFVFMVDGYNDSPDEIYEIPAVRAYYRKLDQEWPYLLFFANTELESLAVITWCLMGNISCAKAVGTQALTKYDIPELLLWMGKRFGHMAHLMQKAHGARCSSEFRKRGKVSTPCDQAVVDRTRTIFQSYNLPFNEDI